MRTAERSAVLEHPAREVFAFLSDIGNLRRWQPGVVRAEQISPPPVRAGTTARVDRWLFEQVIRADVVVTRLEPDRLLVLEAETSGVRLEASFRLEPVDDEHCRATFGMTIRATNAFMLPLEAIVAQAAEADLAASLDGVANAMRAAPKWTS